jgi:hypothetical protein
MFNCNVMYVWEGPLVDLVWQQKTTFDTLMTGLMTWCSSNLRS